jgi:hypothetical protein
MFAAPSAILLASLLTLSPPLSRQEGAAPLDARALWERACKASGSAGRAPLEAFRLEAEVRTRSGVQSNDATIDLAHLAPDCIRFMLPSKNTTGCFGPAPEQYWLQSPDGVVVLAGREYKEDRKSVDDMLALVRNYVALSDPSRLRIEALARMEPPTDLPPELARRARKLAWIVFDSPDFALVKSEVARSTPGLFRIELGLRGEDGLPALAVIREKAPGGADPLLVEFSAYRPEEEFVLPMQIRVHVLDRAELPARFTEKAAQEVYVKTLALRPKLTRADFEPKR